MQLAKLMQSRQVKHHLNILMYLVSGYVMKLHKMNVYLRSHQRCVKAQAWFSLLKNFRRDFFDVAIAEQHAVTLAAGMACEGLKPVVAIYSTFLQRGYDQLIHDVALQNLDVTFGIDRAGLVGEDGPTHAGAYDYAYMRTVPNMVIMAPKDENECRQMLHTAYVYNGPAAVRYPRGAGVGVEIQQELTAIELGKAEIVAEIKSACDEQITILAFGSRVMVAIEAAEQFAQKHDVGVRVVNMRFVKPLDEKLFVIWLSTHIYLSLLKSMPLWVVPEVQ